MVIEAVSAVLIALLVSGALASFRWLWGKRKPRGLTVHTGGVIGCGPVYSASELAGLSRDWVRLVGKAVPVSAPGYDPWEVHLTLLASEATVVVTNVNVEISERRAPPTQGTVVLQDGCGGGLPQRPFDLDLDQAVPVLVPHGSRPSGRNWDPVSFPITVGPGDPESLVLLLRAHTHEVRFSLTVHWVEDGREGSVRLDGDRNGFHLTGAGTLPTTPLDRLPLRGPTADT